MKNILEILSGLGIEVAEDKKAELTRQTAENYKTVAEFEKAKNRLEVERDNYKDSLETAQNTLKEFEGVDVKDLQGKVAKLTSDLADKDTEYRQKIEDMEFQSVIDAAISASGARNAKAVKALLDVETLRASKNRTEDIKAAIETVKGENGFMFGSDEPVNNPVAPTDTKQTDIGITKERFAKMGYSERLNLKRTYPEKYKELKGE
jgi:hypothetical protein